MYTHTHLYTHIRMHTHFCLLQVLFASLHILYADGVGLAAIADFFSPTIVILMFAYFQDNIDEVNIMCIDNFFRNALYLLRGNTQCQVDR